MLRYIIYRPPYKKYLKSILGSCFDFNCDWITSSPEIHSLLLKMASERQTNDKWDYCGLCHLVQIHLYSFYHWTDDNFSKRDFILKRKWIYSEEITLLTTVTSGLIIRDKFINVKFIFLYFCKPALWQSPVKNVICEILFGLTSKTMSYFFMCK